MVKKASVTPEQIYEILWEAEYYNGRSRLDDLIADPTVDIRDVVREVERLCDREAQASNYYRDNPDLQYPAHPWIRFVASGQAAHLGWCPDASG